MPTVALTGCGCASGLPVREYAEVATLEGEARRVVDRARARTSERAFGFGVPSVVSFFGCVSRFAEEDNEAE